MLRSGATTTSRSASSAATAGRLRRPGWREPRLLVGLGLVVAAIAATTATVTYGDATEPFAVADRDLEVGQSVTAEDLRTVDLRLESTGEQYVARAQQLEEGSVVLQRVPEGQLIPAGSLGRQEDIDRRPIGIPLATQIGRAHV